jgi:hypothetical protein
VGQRQRISIVCLAVILAWTGACSQVSSSSGSSCDPYNSWEILDTYQLDSDENSTAYKFAFSSDGIMYSIGRGLTGGVSHVIVKRSTDRGSTWTVVDDYVGVTSNEGTAIAVDSTGVVYTIGAFNNVDWMVRRSDDQGDSWQSVDTFNNGTYTARPQAIAIDSSDGVFVVGYTDTLSGDYFAVVRQSTTGASGSFSTLDDYLLGPSGMTAAYGIAFDESENVYVYGSGYAGPGLNPAFVRYADASDYTTWTTLMDDYVITGGTFAIPNSLTFNSQGHILLSVNGTNATGSSTVVLLSTDAGVTWTESHAYARESTGSTKISSLLTHSNGEILMLGYATSGTDVITFLKSSDDDGVTWDIVEEYSETGQGVVFYDLIEFNDESLVSVGSVGSAWILRNTTCVRNGGSGVGAG